MLICEAVEPDGKSCSKCGEYKPLSLFSVMLKGRYGRRADCKACLRVSTQEAYYSKRCPSQSPEAGRVARLRNKYGLTVAAWEALYESQEHRCALCLKHIDKVAARVDHCHTTGRVRALLCNHCNVGLGHFFDNGALVQRAAAYLEMHNVAP